MGASCDYIRANPWYYIEKKYDMAVRWLQNILLKYNRIYNNKKKNLCMCVWIGEWNKGKNAMQVQIWLV